MIKLKIITSLIITLLLSSCGFQLRGYQNHNYSLDSNHYELITANKVKLNLVDNQKSRTLKSTLVRELKSLGINTDTADNISSISIKDLHFRRYELVGVLTEVRIIINADVTYKIIYNDQEKLHKQPIQIERSYQYNQASISFEDQQGQQMKEWLYKSLAKRIAEQYFTLNQINTTN